MWPFGSNALDKALAVVLAENSDLKQRIRDLEDEKRQLLDRVMALTNPGALREVRHRPLPKGLEAPPGTHEEQTESERRKTQFRRYPGNELLVPPTRPAEPPNPFPPPPPPEPEAS